MNDNNAIEVVDIYKKFKNYFDKSNNLKEKILHRDRNNYDEHWVLRGVSFEVRKGEAVGLIGRNGCGKSTTLKLLTKIIYPDKGKINIRGRVSSLLELGAGFHPDLSGYENIYLNAAVFGLNKREIDLRIEEIIRFSELEEFISNPIRTYSSGMYMKLAFSVAINVDADILLIDEILGVGDVSFQKKCFEKLVDIKNNGTTIVIVSHSTDQIEKICDRSIWLENGMIKMEGSPGEVHADYLEAMEERRVRRKEKEKREEEERRELQEKVKRNILVSGKQRRQERTEIEKRKSERRMLREQIKKETDHEAKIPVEELREKEEKENQRQRELIEIAERERQKQQIVQSGYKREEIPEHLRKFEYYKKETDRLGLVVNEKNIEIERLNSVITQKELQLERVRGSLTDEVSRLNGIIIDKDEEIDRINEVILKKDEEIDRLNEQVISAKS